jgi:replicative superfamily II helicase
MPEEAFCAMPPKGDPAVRVYGHSAILCEPGEVAEWLKAAPC